jgi:hypothetical protein
MFLLSLLLLIRKNANASTNCVNGECGEERWLVRLGVPLPAALRLRLKSVLSNQADAVNVWLSEKF